MEPHGNPKLQGTGRHLSDEELRAWTRFLDASRLLEHVLARHLVDEHDMSHSEYEILVRLDGSGGSLRLSVLADQCVSSKSRLTHTLDRVEKRGWIVRESAPEDGRGINAVITASGSKKLQAAAQGHASLIRSLLIDQMSADEIPVVADVMDRVSVRIRSKQA